MLIIDPFGISCSLFQALLWLLPALITFECLSDNRISNTCGRSSFSIETISDLQAEYQTAKWIDFWICSTGLQVGASVYSLLFQHGRSSATGMAQRTIPPMVSSFQAVLLGWWIMDIQAETSISNADPSIMAAKDGTDGDPTEVTTPQSTAQGDLPVRRVCTNISSLPMQSASLLIGAEDAEESTFHPNGHAPIANLPSLETKRRLLEPKGKKITQHARRKRSVDSPSLRHNFRSVSSYSSDGSLTDDEESISDSDSSSGSKRKSISPDVAAGGAQSQIPPSSNAGTLLSVNDDMKELLVGDETPVSALVELDSDSHQSSASPNRSFATDNQRSSAPELTNVPPVPLPVITIPEHPQRASKIIAQLDSLLFDELEKLAVLSPADTQVLNSANDVQSSTSPLTPRVAALESKRGTEHPKTGQHRPLGRHQVPRGDAISPLDKVSEETQFENRVRRH